MTDNPQTKTCPTCGRSMNACETDCMYCNFHGGTVIFCNYDEKKKFVDNWNSHEDYPRMEE